MKKSAVKQELPKSPIEIVFTVCNRGDGKMVLDLLEAMVKTISFSGYILIPKASSFS